MDIDVEELQSAIDYLDEYLYDDAKLSDKKIEKIRNLLADILEQINE